MKYLRRTDKKYLPLERLLHPQMLMEGDYYRESDYSATFSKEIEKPFENDDTASNIGKPVKKVLELKDIEKLKRFNSSFRSCE